MSESVYIETSVIGYLTARSTKNLVIAGNIETTRDWWQNRRKSLYSNIFEDYQLLINN
ncbi:MAG: type II toxin-antitoxin system VapC family toxin [Microcystis aeruginosa LG13-03]|nr:type II toxin-antitoxin system VapC family toxin [Microcystis aeruginosa LG13-03]